MRKTLAILFVFVGAVGSAWAQDSGSSPGDIQVLENGDVNGDGARDVGDAVYLLNHLFSGGRAPAPITCTEGVAAVQNGDVNADRQLDLSDAMGLLGWLFIDTPEPRHACEDVLGEGGSTSGAHFQSASASVENDGALAVRFDEAGLGNQNVNYELTADAVAVYGCVNGGSKHPRAANKETIAGQVSTTVTIRAKNGRVISTILAGPLSPGDFSCPSGQTLVLANVSYSNIVLTDTTNGVSVELGSESRTFVELR